MSETEKSRMPPPLPCLLAIIAGIACGWIWPWSIVPHAYALTIGIVLSVVAITSLAALSQAFKRHATPADPTRETTAIANTGPFRFSRNPVYVTFAVLQAAIGFFLNNAWILVLIVPAMAAIQHVVVRREEAYLEVRFGEEYLKYKARVRRWI